ncbi:hypothetical protein GH714_007341 [Hevea brasiliensis]|uniref:Uncharacterized protein n=1 Tax=Hevea brasiliensis TaxID=3981 RepID=A0A6A6LAJ5_HEVBR|nr:hypothetical protein GH714_007341 [Hevea brasiliensis]
MLETVKYLMGSAGSSGFGSKSTADQVTAGADLRSITAIITGATSGIGAETARVLAKHGARLVLPARSLKAAEDTKARIVSECPDSEILVMALDLSSLNSVRNFVAEFESLNLPLNLLINNAGKFAHEHAISEDGIEMTFATNYLDMVFFMASKLLKTIPQAAATTCYVAAHPRLSNVSGKYFADCNEASSTSKLGSSSTEAARLWSASEIMVSRDPKAVFDPLNATDYGA